MIIEQFVKKKSPVYSVSAGNRNWNVSGDTGETSLVIHTLCDQALLKGLSLKIHKKLCYLSHAQI